MAISYEYSLEIDLNKENIGMFIGKEGSNINNNVNNKSLTEYCNAMNQHSPSDFNMVGVLQIMCEDEKVYVKWNKIDEIEMRVFNPIVKKYIIMEAKKISSYEVKDTSVLVIDKVKKPNTRGYVIQVNIPVGKIPVIIGKKGSNCNYLKDKIRSKIEKCGSIYIEVKEDPPDDGKMFNMTDKFGGGGSDVWLYFTLHNCAKVFPIVHAEVKEFLEKLWPECDDESDETDDEYESFSRGDW